MKKVNCTQAAWTRSIVSLAGCVLLLAGGSPLLGANGGIALLVSDHTYAYFTNAYEPFRCNVGDWNLGTQEYRRYYMGWEVVLKEAQKSYRVIKDGDVTPAGLQPFGVLILSNAFWLDRAQTRAIAEWVRRGGRLLATYGSGYAGVEGDFVEGGTDGLHELWGDPSAKVNSSFYLGNPWVKVQITRGEGPTGGLSAGAVIDYQYMANVLVQRPSSSRDINAFFLFNDVWSRRPAVFDNRHSKGQVVYYAFAPEYLIALASDVAGHCTGPGSNEDTRYQDPVWLSAIDKIAGGLKPLMKSTLEYLLSP